MKKCFYLICPTDCLEHVINKKFKSENYFYTSLGNSFAYDGKTMEYLYKVIKKHDVNSVYFILSIDNKIISDALGTNEFIEIAGLNKTYKTIKKQKKRSAISFENDNTQFTMLSYYLNTKIKELELYLIGLLNKPITISGKIYNKNQDVFTNIYSNLVCLEKHHLN